MDTDVLDFAAKQQKKKKLFFVSAVAAQTSGTERDSGRVQQHSFRTFELDDRYGISFTSRNI